MAGGPKLTLVLNCQRVEVRFEAAEQLDHPGVDEGPSELRLRVLLDVEI